MKITEFWTIKTNELMPRLGTHAAAMNQVSKTYPDCVTLLRAYGATRRSVVQFCNSKYGDTAANLDADKRRQMQKKIQEEMKSSHCDYSTAFNRIYPQFTNDNNATAATIANIADGVPIPSPKLLALFELPTDTTPSEWAAAWDANNAKTFPINFARVFDAICEVAQKEKGLSYEAALDATKTRFFNLWATVQKMAKTPV
jgi:hypothetical protein